MKRDNRYRIILLIYIFKFLRSLCQFYRMRRIEFFRIMRILHEFRINPNRIIEICNRKFFCDEANEEI